MRQKKFLSEQDIALKEKEFVLKYGVSRATYYRAKKSGYFIPDYHERIININDSFVSENWNLIIECSTIAMRMVIGRRKGNSIFKLFKGFDLRDEAILKMVERSGHIVEIMPKIRYLRGFLINMAVNDIKTFIKSKVYRHSDGHVEVNDYYHHYDDSSFDNLDTEKFIKDMKEAIISQYGEYGWKKVWEWANSDIRKLSKEIQEILNSVNN